MLKRAPYFGFALGILLGVLASYVHSADASRNSSGTYSLPAGQPVVSGTTITSATFNALTADLSTEITNSLDRNGRGAMLAPLQCSNGTVAAPSLTFGSDLDTGLYRIGANNIGFTAGGVKFFEGTATTATLPLATTCSTTLAVTGAASTAAGLASTNSATNGTAITATGNGAGGGVSATGGTTSGVGIDARGGAPNGNGGTFTGDGTGAAISSIGGDTSGSGGDFTGGPPNGHGVRGYGDGTGNGVYGIGGDTSGDGIKGVGGTPNGNGGVFDGTGSGNGIVVGTGFARFNGTNPSSSTAFSNTLTTGNIVKAWANVVTNGTVNPTVNDGFNIASITCGGTGNDDMYVTMASAMTGATHYAVIVTSNLATTAVPGNDSATGFHVSLTGSPCDTGSGLRLNFVVLGYQ